MFVLVTGANGQLGKTLNRLVDKNKTDHRFVFSTRDELDLTDFKKIRIFIEKNQYYKQTAKRPKYVLLDKSKIKDFYGLEIISWKDSLNKCIQVLSNTSSLN